MGKVKDWVSDARKNLGRWTANEVTRLIAPPMAIASMAGKDGDGILDNIVAIYHVPATIYKLLSGITFIDGEAMYKLKAGGAALKEVGEVFIEGLKNMYERPLETAEVAAGVYITVRTAPYIIRGTSKLFKKKEE